MRVTVTTRCPTCGRPYIREMYEECVIAGCVLEMCDTCSEERVDLITMESRYEKL